METIQGRPTMQSLVKEAMSGAAARVSITDEAARSLGHPQEKTAAPALKESSLTPGTVIEKTAAALEWLAKKAADPGSAQEASPGVGPGQGPGAVLEVLTPKSTGANVDAGQQGQATAKNQPPLNPPMAPFSDNEGPSNAMATNIDMRHKGQPVDPMNNERASNEAQKTSAALAARNLQVLLGSTKQASVYERNLAVLGITKKAEDAINPAQISAGPASAMGEEAPDGVSASGEGPVPAVPSDVSKQENLIGSNESAINFTRRQAKADPKRDLGQVLSEPALSSATDKGLSANFEHTESSGAKVASSRLIKTAAAHALLLKMAAEAEAEAAAKRKPKEKNSQMGGQLSTPSAQSGFNAATMGA